MFLTNTNATVVADMRPGTVLQSLPSQIDTRYWVFRPTVCAREPTAAQIIRYE